MAEFWDTVSNIAGQSLVAYAGRPQQKFAASAFGVQGYEPGGGIPGYDLIPEPDMGGGGACGPCGPRPVFKYSCGGYRWVYPKKRRRKQLVTKGDIKGLAALKGVLGNGKAMESWIATHGS